MRTVALALVGSMVVLIGAVWLADSAQTFESYYENYGKLKETEHMSRGWVSRVIPESSYNIHEVRRFTGELVAVRFKFQPGDVNKVESSCAISGHPDPKPEGYRCQLSGRSVVVHLEPSGEGRIVISN